MSYRCLNASVRASITNEAGAATLAGILRIARQLGVKTIVEGVERAEVSDLVKLFGADMAQGFYFGRPAPFESVVQQLDEPVAPADR